jgi:predicted phage-related endonuclease
MNIPVKRLTDSASRRHFIGGSDARIIMGQDEKALIRLWQEKRGEVGLEDLSANLIVQLGVVTEGLNRVWYERNTMPSHRSRHGSNTRSSPSWRRPSTAW